MIPLRPLSRVLAQFIFVVSGSVIKATYNAYKQSVNNNTNLFNNMFSNTKLSRIMGKEEAAKILGFDSFENLKMSQISEAHKRLKNINSPSGSFQGSPYLIQRIDAAHHVLSNYFKLGSNNNKFNNL